MICTLHVTGLFLVWGRSLVVNIPSIFVVTAWVREMSYSLQDGSAPPRSLLFSFLHLQVFPVG
jgi:hypothetical protein